jgi:ubiquinone/menaquinone biosynthesis C-methylase UbiE
MANSKGYVDPNYLQSAAQLLRPIKEQSYAWMHLESGHEVLDLGCGPGTDTIAMAERVGDSGRILGIDHDPAMVAEADRRAREAGVGAWVVHQLGAAACLAIESGRFDGCRSERLFQHLPDPMSALSEMIRVTRRDGWVVVLDTDWGSLSLHSKEIEIERRLARLHAERLLHNGYSGRRLYHLFMRQCLADIRIGLYPVFGVDLAEARSLTVLDEIEREAIDLGILTTRELDRWHTGLTEVQAENGLFWSVSLVMVAGRKP